MKSKNNFLAFVLILCIALLLSSCNSILVSKRDVVYFFKTDNAISSYVKRHYLNDSIFVTELLSIQYKPIQCCDTFKIATGKMYYQVDGQFFPYFSKEAFASRDTVFIYYNTKPSNRNHTVVRYVPYEKKRIRGRMAYGFLDLNSTRSGSIDKYYIVYFLPSFGIVAYKEPRVDLSIIQIEKK